MSNISANKKSNLFRFVIRKYIMAKNVQEALKYERKALVNEIFVADNQPDRKLSTAIGFEYTPPQYDPQSEEFKKKGKKK